MTAASVLFVLTLALRFNPVDRPGVPDAAGEFASQPADPSVNPDAIAETYLSLVRQHRSAWSEEVAVRPWVEQF